MYKPPPTFVLILILAALTVSVAAAATPVASFTASERTGLAPFKVQFTDTSTNAPTAWLWDFGDGSSSTLKNPSHTYSLVGTYTVNLTATNADGSNTVSKSSHIAVVTKQPLSNFHFINIYMGNDEGVKYDVPDGVYADNGAYTYVPNTYWVMFRNAGGGVNPLHISSNSNAWSAADVTTTTNQSGYFWVTHSGGQPTMAEGVLMIAVNGTVPDNFRVHIRSSGQVFSPGTPQTYNQYLPIESTYVEGAINQTFDKDDFIYGLQSWKPHSTAGYPIYVGEDQADPNNQFHLMFVDLRAGTIQDATLPINGMMKVEYSFENLESFAAFNIYGWYMQSNHGTGIIMTNSGSSFTVIGVTSPPVADFSASMTTGTVNKPIQFTDLSTSVPTSWAWDFGDGTTSTLQNPVHTYGSLGTFTVSLTATNVKGSDTETKAGYITITNGVATIPGQANPPTDPDGDGKYEDISGNGAAGFADVVLFFKNIEWIAVNEPVAFFDFSGNGGIGFQDIIVLFKELP
jgi:PKD repeat protein